MSQALLNDWMERLKLQDWTIKLYDCCEPEDMADPTAVGCVTYNEVGKQAKIEIMDPDLYGNRIVPFDYEKTLVHELLHLKTTFLTNVEDPMQERVGHQLIDDLAKTLVAVRREALE